MPRPFPFVPHPDVPVVRSDARAERQWRDMFSAMSSRTPVIGSATFAAATSVAVTLATPEMNTDYMVLVEPVANRTYWISAKATTGFTINASGSNSDTVAWALFRN